jgi:hypothetical protein
VEFNTLTMDEEIKTQESTSTVEKEPTEAQKRTARKQYQEFLKEEIKQLDYEVKFLELRKAKIELNDWHRANMPKETTDVNKE